MSHTISMPARLWPCIPAVNHLVARWRHRILAARQVHLIHCPTINYQAQLKSKARQSKCEKIIPNRPKQRKKEKKKESDKITRTVDGFFMSFCCWGNKAATVPKRNKTHEETHEETHRGTKRRTNPGLCPLCVIYIYRYTNTLQHMTQTPFQPSCGLKRWLQPSPYQISSVWYVPPNFRSDRS